MPASASERYLAAALLAFALTAAGHAVGAEPGEGKRARPALLAVPLAAARPAPTVAAAADVGGGFTEALTGEDEAHQRLGLSAAASVQALSWLDFGLLLDGHYDRHGADQGGTDDGFVLQPELSARGAWQSGRLGFGLELSGWLPPGPDVAGSLSGLSADGRLLLGHHGERWVLAGYAGYRLDRSSEAAADAPRLRFGDRVALGASEFDAALVGLGLGYAIGKSWLLAEVNTRLLYDSPQPAASPISIAVGGRHPLSASGRLSLELSLTALLSSRPDVAAGAALMPIEPRALLSLGLRYRSGSSAATPPPRVAPKPVAPPPPPPPAVVPPASLELTLLDERGAPLTGAKVTLIQGQRETSLAEGAPGRYRHESPEPGPARVRIEADGFQTVERELSVGAGAAVRVDVQAQPALPAGQVRGLVRSQRGKALAAKVRIEPAGVEGNTDADGFFQLDVPPGQYDVVIEADGYQPQRRAVKVEQQGVVIVNADLGQAR